MELMHEFTVHFALGESFPLRGGPIDVQAQIRTEDAPNLYIHDTGSLELNEAVMAAAAGDGETHFGAQYWYTHVRRESGAEQYQWVNRALFVGQGRMATDGIDQELYPLV
jgi:hypothetical protein